MEISLKAAWSAIGRNLFPTDPRLIGWYGGGPTSSGETVSHNSALQIETVYACVKLIAGTLSTLPAQFYKKDSEGRGSVDYSHPLYSVLHDLANADMTAVVFWEAIVACLLIWGNAYARISKIGRRIVALTPIRPERISRPIHRADGSVYYDVITAGSVEHVDESEIFHIKGFSVDGEVGISPVTLARETLGLSLAAEKAAGSLFRNGMRSTFAISLPTFLDDARRKRFDEDFFPKFTGSLNAGRAPVLEGGFKIENLGMNPADAQLLATRAFSIEQICRWFGVQPVMIGHMEKSTAWGSGLEQMNLWFLTYTLRPILRSIEQEVSRSLLSPVERTQYYAEFNVEGLQRADSAGRAALMKVYAENGLRTRNELRALDNCPPLPGGDDLTVMSNMIPVEMLGVVARFMLDKPLNQQTPGAPGPATPPTPPANENQGVAAK
jgi:HK97 family phage portal protein